MSRGRSPWVVIGATLVVALFAAAVSDRALQPAEAEPDPGGTASAPPAAPAAGGWSVQSEYAPARSPFLPAPSAPGALRYEDLAAGPIAPVALGAPDDPIPAATYQAMSRETRASVEDADTWAQTQNGAAVNAAWSHYTEDKVAEAALRRAEYEAGLAGIGDVGVE